MQWYQLHILNSAMIYTDDALYFLQIISIISITVYVL